MKINIKPFHFTELLNKGYSLDGLYLLELIQNEKDVESLSKENSKIDVLLSSLRRKELIKEGKLELTLKGQELLQFLDTKAKPLKIKKTDDSEFTKWWNTFPGTDTFVHNNQQFKGARSLRVNKDACRVKFEKIILEGEYTANDLIHSLEYHVEQIKERSVKERQNKLTYLQNSLTYLNQRVFEPFIELARNEQQIEKKVSNYINGTDI